MDQEFEWSGEFTWDPEKNEHNLRKHGLPLRAGIVLFSGHAIVLELLDDRHHEPRFVRLGRAAQRFIVVVWAQDGYDIRLISVREATKHEREMWQLRFPR